MLRHIYIILVLALLVSCNANIHSDYHVDHLNGYTPWEDKGDVDWVNAMLSTIETEHIMRGDSVNLSPYYALRHYTGKEKGSPLLLIDIIEKHGIVPYDSYSRSKDDPPPLHVFMLGAEYTPQEFARSVCAPNEYIQLTTKEVSADSLMSIAVQAVNNNHGVCWQGNNGECKAIVGLSHDDAGNDYFIIKGNAGLEFVAYTALKSQSQALVLPRNITE